MEKATVKEAMTIAVEVLTEIRQSHDVEFGARDVIDLGKAVLFEEGKNKRTTEINEAGRAAPASNSISEPAPKADPAPGKKGFPAKPSGRGDDNGKFHIKNPDAPATEAQWKCLYGILKEQNRLSSGQKPSDYLLNYFGVEQPSEVTRGMASEAIEIFKNGHKVTA